MKPFPRDQMFGTFENESVMVVSVPDDISDLKADCIIEYYSPLMPTKPGTRKTVAWGDVKDLNGPAVAHQ